MRTATNIFINCNAQLAVSPPKNKIQRKGRVHTLWWHLTLIDMSYMPLNDDGWWADGRCSLGTQLASFYEC
jgi:hypothetical protein